ncbi:unnamed protein product [Mesocestoides corti]|uniref:Ribosomal protein L7Ae/L30e/S12e/Gadd45 domain-containing protein n=1 Tax=Mesocestoides corti TaxID=53468 RepID=A0A0R3UCE1_MESCO|nr:unnamed protein product [Mesocestoides corti]
MKNAKRPLTDVMKARLLSRFRSTLAESSAPKRRGKERAAPKTKRLSVLKRGIVNDRKVRRELQQLLKSNEAPPVAKETPTKVLNIAPPRIPELDSQIEQLLKPLAEFHDRAYKQTANQPAKRKSTRRIICGFHEAIKNLKLNKLKFLIVASDLEKGAYQIGACWIFFSVN